jgi:DNA-binding MarR family transcriptional regulator
MEFNDTFQAERAAMARYFADLGMARSLAGYSVLRFLYFAGGHGKTQNDIRDHLGVSTANVSHLVDVLENEGLVTRRRDRADKRYTLVSLTPEGSGLAARMVPAMIRFMEMMCEGLSKEEKEVALRLVERMHKNVERIATAEKLQISASERSD